MKRFCCLIIFLSLSLIANAQRPSRIELMHADVSEFDSDVHPGADRLIGKVAFRHENAVMTCDSAYLFKEANNLEAFGNVRITQGDSLTMTGQHLIYLGDSRL